MGHTGGGFESHSPFQGRSGAGTSLQVFLSFEFEFWCDSLNFTARCVGNTLWLTRKECMRQPHSPHDSHGVCYRCHFRFVFFVVRCRSLVCVPCSLSRTSRKPCTNCQVRSLFVSRFFVTAMNESREEGE
jgi:hypothetical protein